MFPRKKVLPRDKHSKGRSQEDADGCADQADPCTKPYGADALSVLVTGLVKVSNNEILMGQTMTTYWWAPPAVSQLHCIAALVARSFFPYTLNSVAISIIIMQPSSTDLSRRILVGAGPGLVFVRFLCAQTLSSCGVMPHFNRVAIVCLMSAHHQLQQRVGVFCGGGKCVIK